MGANRVGAWLVGVMVLAGCSNAVGSATEELGTTCEPVIERPIYTTSGDTLETGSATFTTDAANITVHIEAAVGFELGDFYIALGSGPTSLTWYTVNPEPWVTGWAPSIDLVVPLASLGLTCGSQFKAIVYGHERGADGVARSVSALGDGSLGDGSWYSFYDVCCQEVDTGCTLTQGYWKTHPEAWAVTTLVLGGRTYSGLELMALFGRAPRGDASLVLVLAHQLIAAELNAANGATRSPDLAAAHAWLAANGSVLPFGVRASTTAGAQAVAIADRLASYNEGATGPGHCGE